MGRLSAWRVSRWICVGVVLASVAACVLMAAWKSEGLTSVTVTALDPAAEPSDHDVPFVRRKEALPDYELDLVMKRGRRVQLGTKPDESAKDGLTWRLDDPVPVADIATVRLRERDHVVSDAVAEVQAGGPSVSSNGYRIELAKASSVRLGLRAFFDTPIGKAITAGFFLAVLILVLSNFA